MVPHLKRESRQGDGHEEVEVHRGKDHCGPGGAGTGYWDGGGLPQHGISGATFYKWKAKFGGIDVSEARKLKMLETENARLKKLLADAMLDNAVLKDLPGKS